MRKLLICSAMASCFMFSNLVSAQTYTSIHSPGNPLILEAKMIGFLDLTDLIKSDNHLSFAVKDPKSGAISYTHNPKFVNQNDGYYYQDQKRLQGYPVPTDILSPDCKLDDVKSPPDTMPAVATTKVQYTHGNLNANDPVIPSTTPFDPNKSATYNFRTTTQIYDSLGVTHKLAVYYIKSAANTWTIPVLVDDSMIATGNLTFNSSGTLTTETGMDSLTFYPTTGAVSPQKFSLHFPGFNQYGMPDSSEPAKSDGMAPGIIVDYQLENNGYFSFNYNNGKSITFTKIAVFKV